MSFNGRRAARIKNMATGPLLMRFPKPIGREMSFRIYRLTEKRHRVRGRKRAFAQTITTPRRQYFGAWPGRNEQAGQMGSSTAAHRQHEGAEAKNSNARRRRPQRERKNSRSASFSLGLSFWNFSATCSASPR